MKKYCIVIAFIVAVLALSVSCRNDTDINTEILPDATPESVTFTDALGRVVSVEKNPQNVACLIGSFAEIWMLSGGHVAAAASDAWEDFDLSLDEGTVNIGGAHSPNLELIFSSHPDFIIASASTASHVEFKEVFEKSGTVVAYFDVDCFDDYLSMLKICTLITGRDDLYVKNGVELGKRIDEIKSDFLSLDLSDDDKKILLLRTASTFVKAKGSEGTILGEMLADIGCINIADNDKSLLENVSVEKIIAENPKRIFVVTMGNNDELAIKNINAMINDNPAWSELDAVKNGNIHYMDKKLFNIKPNSRWADAYDQLVRIFKEK